MNFMLKQPSVHDNLGAVCAQMQPDLWAKDNEMTSYKPELLIKFLETGHVLVLAYDGEKIAGVAIAYELPHPAGEHSLYVHELDTHPDYRRQGIGTQLMEEMKRIAKERDVKELWVGTEVDNTPANALYTKFNPTETEQAIIYSYDV